MDMLIKIDRKNGGMDLSWGKNSKMVDFAIFAKKVEGTNLFLLF